MKLNLDLDNEDTNKKIEVDVDVPGTKSSIIEAAPIPSKHIPNGEDIILPIKGTDETGNLTYHQKALDAMTGDEFMSWVYDVLPLDEQNINKIIRLRGGDKVQKAVQKLNVRKEIFQLVVHMHEEKWLFLRGRDRHPDYAKWN